MAIVEYDNNDLGYQRFNLKTCEAQLSQYCCEKDIDAIAHENYFIAPKILSEKQELFIIDYKECYRVNKEYCKFARCDLLAKHNLVMGNYVEKSEVVNSSLAYLTYFVEFKNIIIDAKLFWIIEFFKAINIYLKNRRSIHSTLINKEIIQATLGETVSHIKSAEQYRHFSKDITLESAADYQLFSVKELRSAANLLAKLHGGRSFLSGNVIEMIMMFEYFRDIYFS